MAKVKLDLQKRDDDDLLLFAKTHITKLADNAVDFPGPHDPTAAELATLVAGFEATLGNVETTAVAAATAVSAKDDSRVLLEGGLNGRGRYIEGKSGGLETKILSVGFGIRALNTPLGELPAPENLRATFGDDSGENDLAWDWVHGARSYPVEYRETGTPTWNRAPDSPKSKCTVTGLTSGKSYDFRVCAFGTEGNGPWSNIATKMAP